jgi:hypothetical protein
VIVVKRVAHAREEAQRETFARLAHEFTDVRCAALDGLLVTDPEVKTTRLRWLATGPVEASPAAVKAEVAKLAFLRGLGADVLDLSVLPAERRRFLATVGRRLTAQALERRDPQRRYPILLTLLAQSATDVLATRCWTTAPWTSYCPPAPNAACQSWPPPSSSPGCWQPTGPPRGRASTTRPPPLNCWNGSNRIADVCEAHGVPVPQAALAFPLRHPAVAGIVVGMRSAQEVRRIAAAYAARIPAGLWSDLCEESLVGEAP